MIKAAGNDCLTLRCGECIEQGLIMQVLGDNLLSLIKAYSYRNIPLELVKHIAKQVMYTHFVLPLCIWNRACVCVPSTACCGNGKRET